MHAALANGGSLAAHTPDVFDFGDEGIKLHDGAVLKDDVNISVGHNQVHAIVGQQKLCERAENESGNWEGGR